MKKLLLLITTLILAVSLVGCGSSSPEISKKKLSDEETKLLKMFSLEGSGQIYDYKINKDVKRIEVKLYALDSKLNWKMKGSVSSYNKSKEGQIGVFYGGGRNFRLSIESGGDISAGDFSPTISILSSSGVSQGMSFYEEGDVKYNQEIPLMLQITTKKASITNLEVNNFNNTSKFKGYENVIAVTVKFVMDDNNK